MVSAQEARLLYELLQRIETKMDTLETKSSLELRVSLAELNRLALQTLSILSRMGLGEDAEEAIRIIRRLIITLNSLRIAIMALQAGTPMGMILAALGLFGTAVALLPETDGRRRF
jgi:hypothetical protein